jgi:hypothetical protein
MPLDCNDGAALRVAPVKGPDPKLRNEFCPQVSLSQVRDACGPHDGNGKNKTEHAEFPMDPRCSPGWILGNHLENQFPNLLGRLFPSIQCNHVVEEVSSAASHPALRDAILPRTAE